MTPVQAVGGSRHTARWCAVVLGAASFVTGALALGPSADASAGAGRATAPKVFVSTSGQHSELVETVPITRRAGAKKRVVMSLAPSKLPDLRRRDQLKVTAEVQVTLDCFFRQPRCVGPRPYSYSPVVATKLVLAGGERTTGGAGAIPLTSRKRHVCLAGIPHREHHCVMVFRHGGVHVDGRLPCAPDRCRINLVLSAYDPNARQGNRLIIGGAPPDGTVSQDRGRVNAVVFRPRSQPRPKPEVTKSRRRTRLPLDEKFRVVYSKRLRGLDQGDQLTVDAHATAGIHHLPYNARVSSQLILADRRDQIHPGRLARRVARGGPEVSETNGFNCVRPRAPCTFHRVGTARIGEDVRDGSGDPAPLYVNLTMLHESKRADHDPDDRVRVLDRGAIKVSRYRKP